MKRPLLIAILLLIALSAAPACTLKERTEHFANKVATKLDTASISFQLPILSKARADFNLFG